MLVFQLPDLTGVELKSNQKLGTIVTMTTSTNNPKHQQLLHVNDIINRKNGVIKIAHACEFVSLEESEILHCEQK
jgi:hypothetical protein